MVDVDGSYLAVCKHHHYKAKPNLSIANVVPLKLPSVPLISWESIDGRNLKEATRKILKLTSGTFAMRGIILPAIWKSNSCACVCVYLAVKVLIQEVYPVSMVCIGLD